METKDILKELRKTKGFYNAKDFCEASGISYNTYQNYETGKRLPTAEILMQIADFYGVTVDYLLGREKAPDPFAELNLSTEDEQEVLAKYMSLPENVRAILLDVLIQLGNAARANQTEHEDDCIYETTTAGEAHDRLDAQAHAEENAG